MMNMMKQYTINFYNYISLALIRSQSRTLNLDGESYMMYVVSPNKSLQA
jgi:hypothetical protein